MTQQSQRSLNALSQSIFTLVRDAESIRSTVINDPWDATTLVACVSSDPRSFFELGLSWLRYRRDSPIENLRWSSLDVGDSHEAESEFGDAGYWKKRLAGIDHWLVIDLLTLSIQTNVAELPADDWGVYIDDDVDESKPPIPGKIVWFNLPPFWRNSYMEQGLPDLPVPPTPFEPIDYRGVLYGRSMVRHLANTMLEIVNRSEVPPEYFSSDRSRSVKPNEVQRKYAWRWYELTKQVHADWLMTPREDLDGQMPRDFLHHRDWPDRERNSREHEWSMLRRVPRPLDINTHSYRYGPMGLEEVVIYYDYCREVISAGWQILCHDEQLKQDVDRLGDMLFDYGKNWLETGSLEDGPQHPADVIQSSRRHMPRLADGIHLDCDCPICRMMDDGNDPASEFYLMFTGYDGYHLELDEEFAFSLCATREQFEDDLAAFQMVAEEMEEDLEQHKTNVHQSQVIESDVTGEIGDADPDFHSSILGLGFRLCELVGELQQKKESEWVDRLNAAFDALRGAKNCRVSSESAVAVFESILLELESKYPELTPQSADFQNWMRQWLREIQAEGDSVYL